MAFVLRSSKFGVLKSVFFFYGFLVLPARENQNYISVLHFFIAAFSNLFNIWLCFVYGMK